MEDPGTAYVDANFDWYQPFESIPGALWFSLVTITAVGYGEYFCQSCQRRACLPRWRARRPKRLRPPV